MAPLAIVVLIVLVDLLGFALAIPLLPRFAKDYGFQSWQIGLLMAAYPFCQLFAAPILGRLSDRFGRRPVLAVSQFGTSISLLILGLSHDFWVMLLARALDGASGGNILVAQAYIADVTKPENRSKGLGMIGAAFGIGFVLGPLLGGLILAMPIAPYWQTRLPFLIAAGFSTIAWILVLLKLPESLSPEVRAAKQAARRASSARSRFAGWAAVLASPRILTLVVISSLLTLSFAALEGALTRYLSEKLSWTASESAWAFAFLGFANALVQGGLNRRLPSRFGEGPLVLFGALTLTLGMVALACVTSWLSYGMAAILIALGYGLASPNASGLLSRLTPADEQGLIFGTLSSAQTLARGVNYLVANLLLGQAGLALSAPYWEAAVIALLAFIVAMPLVARLPKHLAPVQPSEAMA